MNVRINFQGKAINIEAKKLSRFGRISGLMFKNRQTDNLLFSFLEAERSDIHSFFVFFSFLAIWLDSKSKVIDFKIVKPFTFLVSPKTSSRFLVELPLNNKNKAICELFVGKRKI